MPHKQCWDFSFYYLKKLGLLASINLWHKLIETLQYPFLLTHLNHWDKLIYFFLLILKEYKVVIHSQTLLIKKIIKKICLFTKIWNRFASIVVVLLEIRVKTQNRPVRLRILKFISYFVNVIIFSLSSFLGTISRFF